MLNEADIRILNTPQELFQAAAAEFIALASTAIRDHEKFSVALSGGSTPKSLYSVLARSALPWDKIFFFWSDERHVPPDHPDSNYRMAKEALLSKVPVPPENLFRVREEGRADLPSQRGHPVNGRLLWLLDKGAASKLSKK